MDFLNKAFTQVKDLFGSMTPAARITAALLLVVVVVSLTYLFQYHVGSANDYLLGGRAFSTTELTGIEAAFAQAGLSDYEIEGSRVKIPRGQKAAYIGAMADGKALPVDFHDSLTEALSSGSPWEAKTQRDARLKHAKQKELSLIIRSMKDIDTATVQYDVAKKGGFPPTEEKTASVCVWPVTGQELDEERARTIRYVVSRSIAGLKPQSVMVTDCNAGREFSAGGDGLGGAADDAYAARKRMHEEYWRKKITDALSYVTGAVIAVNVELDPEVHNRTDSIEYDPKPVAERTEDFSKISTASEPAPSGRPGAASQGAMSSKSIGSTAGSSQNEETRSTQESKISYDQKSVTKASLVPNRVTVTVSVPTDYYRDVWARENPTAEGEEPEEPDAAALKSIETSTSKNIEDAVANLLPPPPPGYENYPLVKVIPYQRLTSPAPPAPGTSEKALAWFARHWGALGMLGVCMVAVMMVRSMVRSGTAAPSAEPAGEEVAPQLSVVAEGGEPPEEEPQERILKRRFSMTGPNLRNELSEMVAEDPDAAAAILRNWIGSVT